MKKTLIVKQREEAKNLCDRGLIDLNGRPAKPSKEIATGDIIGFEKISGTLYYKVIQIPAGNIRKGNAGNYYELTTIKQGG